MKLSDADYNKVCQTLGKHQNNMKFLSALSEIPTESFGRIKAFIESLNLEETDLINLNASFKVLSDMTDESWDRVIQRDLLNELDLKHSYSYADVTKELSRNG